MCTSLDCKRKLEKACREEGEHANSTQEGPSWLLESNQNLLTSYLVHSTNCPSCPGYEQSNNRFEMHGENKQYTGKETFIIPVAKFHEWTDSDVLQMPCLEMALLHHVCGGLTLWPCSHSAWWVMSPRGHSSCWCKNMTYTHRVNTYIGCFHESAAHREMNNTTMLSDFSPEGEWVGNVGKREIHSFSDTDF